MGVVTDVTVKGLTTAVTNISATGMSDTTGQAIVSAINGLSGALSPAASNVTFDNTGTGLSASNVQSAIAEICTDLFQTKTYTVSYTAGGNASISLTADDFGATTPIGYSPIGASDFATQNVNVAVRGIYGKATGTASMMLMRNVSSSSVTATAYITILYVKSLFI